MMFTSYFEPLIIICLSLSLGVLIGILAVTYLTSKEIKMLEDELDVFRKLYFDTIDKLKKNEKRNS